MVTVHTISTQLTAKTADFERGMKKSTDVMKRFELDFKAIGNIAAGVSLSNALGSAANAFKGFVVGQNDAIDNAAKLSDQLGIATEKLAGLQLAGDLAGVGAEELGGNLIRLSKGIGDAVRGQGDLNKTLEELGLNAQHLVDIGFDGAIQEIANATSKLEDPFRRMSIASDLFSKRGSKMISVLAEGGAGLQDAQQKAEKLGLAINRIDAAKIEAANDSITLLMGSFKGLANTLLVNVAPALQTVIDLMTKMMTTSNKLEVPNIDPGGNMKKWEAGFGKAVDLAGIIKNLPIHIAAGFNDADVAAVFEKTITPAERLQAELEKLDRMVIQGAIDWETHARAANQALDAFKGEDKVGAMIDQLREQADVMGKSDKQQALDKAWNLGATHAELREIVDLFAEMDEKTKKLELKGFADNLIEATKTPFEKFGEQVDKLEAAFDARFLNADQFQRGLAQADEMLDKFKAVGVLNESVRGEVSLGAQFGSQEAAGRIDAFRRSGAGTDKTLLDMLKENRDQTRIQRELPKAIAGELRGVIGAADF